MFVIFQSSEKIYCCLWYFIVGIYCVRRFRNRNGELQWKYRNKVNNLCLRSKTPVKDLRDILSILTMIDKF
jgi:hypothetical protein